MNFACASDGAEFNQNNASSIEELQPFEVLSMENPVHEDAVAYEVSDIMTSPKTIEVTQDNYDNYFNMRTGKILDSSGISKGDTLKIGNISNRAFVIDRQLTIMPISEGDVITNGFIHLIGGSDGSTVKNLFINNTKGTLTLSGVNVGQLHGIWLTHSNNNTIAYNTIRIANTGGVYAMPMGWSSNNRIIHNDMKTYVTSVIIMGQCHYNLISNNSLEVLSYSDLSVTNLIYFNPFGHADYSGSPLCLGNVISYNYLKGFCNGAMSIILQMTYAEHDGTVVANNTIIKGSFGVNLDGNDISVYGNVVNDSSVGIAVTGSNFTVHDNNVFGESQSVGISASCSGNSYCEVKNNNITFADVSVGLSVKNHVSAHDNIINIAGYGVGISVGGDDTRVFKNRIKNNHDSGISVLGSSNFVEDNVITTNKYGIAIPSKSHDNRYYNNTIVQNRITSDSYGIYITGLVYNTTIRDNVIITNASVGIFKEITDEQSNTEEDNEINGVILNSTAIVIDDNNFYRYFDDDGNFKHDLKDNRVVILTFLTNKNLIFSDKVKLISNKRSNLLYNVTIILKGDADESLIEGFNFINNGRKAILVDYVANVTILGNNITEIFKNGSADSSPIEIRGVCDNLTVMENNIYVNSKLKYTYAVSAIASDLNAKISKGALFKDNTIIMISTGVCEAIYTDILTESDFISNRINIISDDYAYGIAFADVVGKLNGLNVSFNEIIVHSKQMAYLIELHMVENSTVANNTLYGVGSGVYGIGVYRSDNISIANNSLSVFGGDLSKIRGISDALGIGNAAIAIIKNTNNTIAENNLIHTNALHPITLINLTDDCLVNKSGNYHVLDDENYDVYFDSEGNLCQDVLESGDVLLMYNLTKNQILKINQELTISSYDFDVPATVTIILNRNASKSVIANVSFVNSTIQLDNCSDVLICNSSLLDCILTIDFGLDNVFLNNNVSANTKNNAININNAKGSIIASNIFNITSDKIAVIAIAGGESTAVRNNTFNGLCDDLIFITSRSSDSDEIVGNTITANASSMFVYKATNVRNGKISKNSIVANGSGLAAIYFEGKSKSNVVSENDIISHSKTGDDYAVMIKSDEALFNEVIKNYLISSNGLKIADGAVYAPFDTVHSNTPADVFVSCVNGSDITGDGSKEKPYASISHAIENALKHSTIHIYGGTYTEFNITVDKDINLVSLNPGKVIIDAEQSQLFDIEKSCSMLISGVVIRNAHNVNGGSAFVNRGQLVIDNSIICNSSSYFDNSHPHWVDVVYEDNGEIDYAYTTDCRNSGLGGAILNYGDLTISNSAVYDNLAHWGGAIADFGKTTIESSQFYNNRGVHGGAIFTNTRNPLTIRDSTFVNNTALTTLDYCALRLHTTAWSIDVGNIHQVSSICNTPIGSGGAIYTNTSISIENSIFEDNCAKYGGAVAAIVDSFSSKSSYVSKIDLEVKNSTFINNRANDTRKSSGDNDMSKFPYNSGYDGGVVYGTFNRFYITDSGFYSNQAVEDGGALYAKANDGQILDSVFAGNIAGISGGALVLSKNFIIMRTVISNNSARYGGALEYTSYSYYGHIQDNLNIYNSTISNNRALNRAGAFEFGTSNVFIRDSNIVNNVAPASSTIYASGSASIDMRYNYWGINNGRIGPDDSVWAVSNSQFRPWYKEWIQWNPVISGPETSNPDNNPDKEGSGGNDGSGKSTNTNPSSTGSSISTGTSIGNSGNGNGNWRYSGNGDGSNMGYGGIGNGHNGPLGSLGWNSYRGQNIKGDADANSFDASLDSKIDGDVKRDSLSRTNSSSYNPNLKSVGSTSNAASAASSSQGGGGSSSGSGDSQDVAKYYELDEKVDELLNDDSSFMIFLILTAITLILLVIGYRRNNKKEEEEY
ncbi:right-handed parallel beta-helix repeat-containing protein [Methanobrevibacter sp.]|uniref:right-handed parallel beta-helix repeat-containing protein n=1 Tax=Methanobrevibacter sp. TaxID=66852 RepID=UPI00386E8A90